MPTFNAPTKTVGNVMADVKRTFGDESGIVLEDNDIVTWINTAIQDIIEHNGVLKGRVTFSTIENQQEYPLQQYNIQDIDSVIINQHRIQPVSWAQAQELLYDGQSPTDPGDPTLWWVFEGQLTLWPTPQGVQDVTLYFSARATAVTNSPAALLPLPDKYFPRIVEAVLASAYEMNEDWNAAQAKRQQFDSSISRMGQEEKDFSANEYPFITSVDW